MLNLDTDGKFLVSHTLKIFRGSNESAKVELGVPGFKLLAKNVKDERFSAALLNFNKVLKNLNRFELEFDRPTAYSQITIRNNRKFAKS